MPVRSAIRHRPLCPVPVGRFGHGGPVRSGVLEPAGVRGGDTGLQAPREPTPAAPAGVVVVTDLPATVAGAVVWRMACVRHGGPPPRGDRGQTRAAGTRPGRRL